MALSRTIRNRRSRDEDRRLARARAALFAWANTAIAENRSAGFPNVINALKAVPGCLGVETGQMSTGRQVIFAWFEGKKALVDWYHSEVHQKAMKTLFPDTTFDREPLRELSEDTGTILAIVSVKFTETTADRPRAISSIGIELYGPAAWGSRRRREICA